MHKLQWIFNKIRYSINYFYYFTASLAKNVYPCKLVEAKSNLSDKGIIIIYKILGCSKNCEIPLQKLLENKKNLEIFHPIDAAKLGSIAFKEIICDLPKDKRVKEFQRIKNIMLHSTHDVYSDELIINSEYSNDQCIEYKDLTFLYPIISKNKYYCKLVGGKNDSLKIGTTIVYTLLGKREGYERSLQEILTGDLLQKFHPTEVLKFGFIFEGDSMFYLTKTGKAQFKGGEG